MSKCKPTRDQRFSLMGPSQKKVSLIQNIFGEVHGVLQRFGLEIMICKRKNEQASPAFLQYSI
jgi:hypothetical protein